jgi:putative oxidoreductase
MSVGLLLLRVIVGALFVGHGTQKLFGWFGGHGLDGTGAWMESLGFRRGRVWAAVAGLAESLGGLLLALGFLTPLAAAAIVGVMTTAVLAVHLRNGVWNSDGGYELPLVYATAATAIAFTGPGAYSLDRVIGLGIDPVTSGIVALVLGLLAGTLVNALRAEPVAAGAPSPEERVAA